MSIFTSFKTTCLKFQSVLLAVAVCLPAVTAPVHAVTVPGSQAWYVISKDSQPVRGPGNPVGIPDGKTVFTAWSDFNQINWKQIKPGDVINVAGGAYRTPLEIKQDSIQIRCGFPLPYLPYPNIPVMLQGGSGGAYVHAIRTLGHSNIEITGPKWSSLVVCYWSGAGLLIEDNSHDIKLSNIHLYGNGTHGVGGGGLMIRGTRVLCSQLIVRDNYTVNVSLPAASKYPLPSTVTLSRCWIFRNSAFLQPLPTDGLRVQHPCHLTAQSCIFGPGLQNGVLVDAINSDASVNGCLFINAEKANITKTVNAASGRSYMSIDHAVSFLTPLNSQNKAHACLDYAIALSSPAGNDRIRSSFFYGGAVITRGEGIIRSMENVQYKTSGKTTVLSPSQTPIQFRTPVDNIPNSATCLQLIDLDYTPIRNGVPYGGAPGSINSVNQLLNTNRP